MLPKRSRQIIEEFALSELTEGVVDAASIEQTNTHIYRMLHAFLRRNPEYNISVRMHSGDVVLVKNDNQRTVIRVH